MGKTLRTRSCSTGAPRSTAPIGTPGSRGAAALLPLLCAALLASACSEGGAPPPPGEPAVREPSRAATAGPGASAHEIYAAKAFTCEACHPCGERLPGGHEAAWMDPASAAFHAPSANGGLAACQGCHGPALDGVGGAVSVSCAQCHGATWKTDCTMCHGGVDDAGGAPPKATWGNGADAVRVGAHTSHGVATHGLSEVVACETCHLVPSDALSGGHLDGGTAEVSFTGLAAMGGALPAWDRAQATCASTYCHGATLAGGTDRTPVWTDLDGSPRACDACHGAPPPPPHVASADCGSCHAGYTATAVVQDTHVDGKIDVAAMACNSCHGSAANPAPPLGLHGETATAALAVGAHQRHLAGGLLSGPVACGECHVVPASTSHSDGSLEVAFGPLASAGGATPTWNRGTATCSSTYCHGQFSGGDPLNAPSWTTVDGSQAACGTCHGTPPPPPHSQSPACEGCHTGYTAGSVNLATHVNGIVEVVALGCTSCHGSAANPAPPLGTLGETATTTRAVGAHQTHLAGGTLGPAVACGECHVVPAETTHADGTAQVAFGPRAATGGATPSWDPASLTCAGTYCHGAVLRGGGTNLTPSWIGGPSQVACGSCHGRPPPAPHVHTAVCQNCHPGYTITSVELATHMNGLVEAENLTCSSCHGDDSRVLASYADPLAIAAPPYGSRGEVDTGSRSVGAHQAHVNRVGGLSLPNDCAECHAVPTSFDHSNGLSETAFSGLSRMDGAEPVWDGESCSNTYCHGSTLGRGGTSHSPTWTTPGPLACGTCHGAPPPAPHPQETDCIRCHPGYTQTSVRRTTHVNGISDFPSGCNSCHDDPPATGRHYKHLQRGIGCAACHAGYTPTSENPALHRNARQDVTVPWSASTRTCGTNGCHGEHKWMDKAATSSCNQCHGSPPASGEHYEHAEYGCDLCHGEGYSKANANVRTHIDGTVDVPLAFYSRETLTCAAGACHGTEPWGSREPVTPNCSNCHGFPPDLPHPQNSSCWNCHPSMTSNGTVTETHNDGTLDVSGEGCTSCHGFPPATTRRGIHPSDANCYGCHSTTVDASNQVTPNGTHNDGYVQVGGGGVGTYGCQSCHGDQARQAPAGADAHVKAAPPLGTRGESDPAARAVGAHLAHVSPSVGTLAAPALCGECHVVPTAMDHAMGTVLMQFGGRATLQGAAPEFDAVGLTCSSTYCHGSTLGAGGTNHAPAWLGGSAEADCGTCHDAPPPEPHTQSASCGGCHQGYTATSVNLALHVNGLVDLTAMACNSCHGSAQNAAPPLGTSGETLTTQRAVGAHQRHLAGGAYSSAMACSECHAVPSAMNHSDGVARLAWGPLATAGGAVPSWDPATGTCAASYCHGQFEGGNLLNEPLWTKVDGTQAACGTCHGAPPPPPHTASTACGSCHPGYTQASVNLATHVDGQVQATSYHPAGWIDRAQHGTQANLTGLAGCKSCHGSDLSGGTSGVSCNACHASAGFATWATNCTFCHGSTATGRQNPPVDVQGRSAATNVSVGVHESHATTTMAAVLACTQCHPARTASVVSDATHLDGDGIAEVQFGTLARTGNVSPTYTRSSQTSATCASTYCHGNFTGGASAVPSWTSTAQATCTSCHGSPPSTGRHSTHASKSVLCTNCHNAVVNATNGFADKTLHVNGAKNVKFGGTFKGSTVTGSYTGTGSSMNCTVSCHRAKTWR